MRRKPGRGSWRCNRTSNPDVFAVSVQPPHGGLAGLFAHEDSLASPRGWLGGAGAETLVAFRLQDGGLSVRAATPDDDASENAVSAIKNTFAALIEGFDLVNTAKLVLAVRPLQPDLFSAPLRPLGELLHAAALYRDGECVTNKPPAVREQRRGIGQTLLRLIRAPAGPRIR